MERGLPFLIKKANNKRGGRVGEKENTNPLLFGKKPGKLAVSPAPRIRQGRQRGSGITLQILTRDNETRSIFQNSKWMGKEPSTTQTSLT